MELFLASEGKHPESLKKLDDFVGGLKDKHVAYVVTAANGEYYGSWKGSRTLPIVQEKAGSLEIIQLEDVSHTNVIAPLKKADILWVAGGMTGYLLYWIRRVKLDKALPKILENGTVYVGSSAGSMVASKTQKLANWYLGDPEPGAQLLPGLGLIDFEIYPHYEDEMKDEIEAHWQKGKLCLLKDGEAITVENNTVTFLGEERFIEK